MHALVHVLVQGVTGGAAFAARFHRWHFVLCKLLRLNACSLPCMPIPSMMCSYSLSGSMEVAQLLHKMALADGIPTSQVRLLLQHCCVSVLAQHCCVSVPAAGWATNRPPGLRVCSPLESGLPCFR